MFERIKEKRKEQRSRNLSENRKLEEANNELEVQKSRQLRKNNEHPTTVKEARDHSDNKHLDLEFNSKQKKIKNEKSKAPNQHAMKLRKRN